jgi:tRNA threonylcarbamoyladenosine biosynthesis protein TsaB
MASEERRYLLIETSGRVGLVGLADGGQLVAGRRLDANRRHGRDLAPTVDVLLRESGWRPSDLAAVIVSLGPGSYTGLRVGVMSAKALAFATRQAVVGVPTFEVIAREAPPIGNVLDVIADGQKGKLYVQPFTRRDESEPFLPAAPLALRDGRQWARDRDPARPVTGPGLRVAAGWLPDTTPAMPGEPTVPGLLKAGLARWDFGQLDDPVGIKPIYLRPSSAEDQWARRT